MQTPHAVLGSLSVTSTRSRLESKQVDCFSKQLPSARPSIRNRRVRVRCRPRTERHVLVALDHPCASENRRIESNGSVSGIASPLTVIERGRTGGNQVKRTRSRYHLW